MEVLANIAAGIAAVAFVALVIYGLMRYYTFLEDITEPEVEDMGGEYEADLYYNPQDDREFYINFFIRQGSAYLEAVEEANLVVAELEALKRTKR